MDPNTELRRAQKYVFRLLKVRARAEKELIFRLRQKKFSQGVIDSVVGSFKESGYINDLDFANRWVRERITKPLGFRRLEFELTQKGIGKEIIESALAQVKKQYPEYETVSKLVRDKFGRVINREIDYKVKRKIQGFLSGRGFSADVVEDVLGDIFII